MSRATKFIIGVEAARRFAAARPARADIAASAATDPPPRRRPCAPPRRYLAPRADVPLGVQRRRQTGRRQRFVPPNRRYNRAPSPPLAPRRATERAAAP